MAKRKSKRSKRGLSGCGCSLSGFAGSPEHHHVEADKYLNRPMTLSYGCSKSNVLALLDADKALVQAIESGDDRLISKAAERRTTALNAVTRCMREDD